MLINAPFTREVHDEKFLKDFSKKLADHGAKLVVIWVVTKPEICHQRMIDRNSVRDTWKLEHWDEYVKTIDYSIPEALKKMSSCLDLMLFSILRMKNIRNPWRWLSPVSKTNND